METITGIIIFGIGLFILAFCTIGIGCRNAKQVNKNELKFDIEYWNLETIINVRPVTERSYYEILDYLGQIQKIPCQNSARREKVEVLKNTFCAKYKSISNQILADEHSPDAVFYDMQN